MGWIGADPYTVVRPDAVTIAYIPNTYSQTTIRQAMPLASEELKVTEVANCPKHDQLCGFEEGMTVLIFDDEGHFDFFDITEVQADAAHLQHYQQDLSYPYRPVDHPDERTRLLRQRESPAVSLTTAQTDVPWSITPSGSRSALWHATSVKPKPPAGGELPTRSGNGRCGRAVDD
jgi:hypothetical protein